MKNCPDDERLEAFLAERAESVEQQAIAEHIACCVACQSRLEKLTAIPRADESPAGDREPAWAGDVAERLCIGVQKRMRTDEKTATGPLPDIPGCEVRSLLGRGGMGNVYLAWQRRLERLIAVKVLHDRAVDDEMARSRFAREVAAVGRLNHPGIVTAFDANEYEGVHYLLMEYVPGEDLSHVVRRLGPLPVADACEAVRQAALALQCAHESGMVHRDIKPSNLMLTPQGVVKLLDLGLARIRSDATSAAKELTHTGQVMGTIDYMSPEQGDPTRDIDIRSDIFSLGATIFKLLTGTAPLDQGDEATPMSKLTSLALGRLPSIGETRNDLPGGLAQVVDRMLAHDPAVRFATPGEVASALEPFCFGAKLDLLVDDASDLQRSNRHDARGRRRWLTGS